MSSTKQWLSDLAALAAASPQISELSPLEVGFEVNGAKMGIDLTQGRITDGAAAQCCIAGSDEVLAKIVGGELTLQRAYMAALVQLSGEPESLLRLAFLLDATHALRNRQSGQAIEPLL